jgi:hypothetical protein
MASMMDVDPRADVLADWQVSARAVGDMDPECWEEVGRVLTAHEAETLAEFLCQSGLAPIATTILLAAGGPFWTEIPVQSDPGEGEDQPTE